MPVPPVRQEPVPYAGPQTDAQLVASMGRGDAAAFELVMRRYNRLLFRSARGVVSDDAEAVEAHAQDVYAFAGARCDAVVAHVLSELQRQGRLRPDGSG